MSKTEQDLEDLMSRLSKANTEQDITEHLVSLVKGFTPLTYLDEIRKNPYYVSLFEDVRQAVSDDIARMKLAISEEIEAIEGETSLDYEGMQKLSNLKKECELLLSELIAKEKEIMAIKI